MRQKVKLLLIFFVSLISFGKENQVMNNKQLKTFIQTIRRQGKINKWYIILSITPPESEAGNTVIVEKRRSGEFYISWFLLENSNKTNKSVNYKKIINIVNNTDSRYKLIEKIETLKTQINSWGGGIILDGDQYRLEVDSIETQTVFNFTNKSFDGSLREIKDWINFVFSSYK